MTYRDAIALDRHSGGPQQKISDGAAFLWRSELAGQPRDAAAWRALHDYANSALPRPGSGLADLHVILAHSVLGDEAALDARARQMEDLAREAGVSRFHLLRLYKKLYGQTPLKRLTFLRMEEAKRLLKGRNETIPTIAARCGYENPSHFATAFRRVVGVTPRSYRR